MGLYVVLAASLSVIAATGVLARELERQAN